jgi:hypothetical protein
MDDERCPIHPDYDGVGDPPDAGCAECLELREEVGG